VPYTFKRLHSPCPTLGWSPIFSQTKKILAMRMRYISMAVACMCHVNMWSQDCLTNAAGISTNPDASVNPQCPGNVVFDWRQDKYPYKANPSGLPPVEFEISSPFSNETNVLYPMLWDVNDGGGDYLPADGWELIQPGVYTHNPDIINYNYVVLYNRYTSILRVVFFLSPSLGDDYSFVVVKLRFRIPHTATRVSALLHPRTGISQPMDQFSVAESQATVLYTNKDYDCIPLPGMAGDAIPLPWIKFSPSIPRCLPILTAL
jgi:hypothetical protein